MITHRARRYTCLTTALLTLVAAHPAAAETYLIGPKYAGWENGLGDRFLAKVEGAGRSGTVCVRLEGPWPSERSKEEGCGEATVEIDDALGTARLIGTLPSTWEKITTTTTTTTTGTGKRRTTQTTTTENTETGTGSIRVDLLLRGGTGPRPEAGLSMPCIVFCSAPTLLPDARPVLANRQMTVEGTTTSTLYGTERKELGDGWALLELSEL